MGETGQQPTLPSKPWAGKLVKQWQTDPYNSWRAACSCGWRSSGPLKSGELAEADLLDHFDAHNRGDA